MSYDLLSNFDIIELADEMNINLIGVFAKDNLKNVPIQNGGYVINLDDSTGQGTHWTGFYIDGNNAIYFDSFGQVPPLSVERYCRNKNFIHSDFIIQNLNQVACGYYQLAFLHYMTNSKHKNSRYKLNNFIKPFDLDDTTQNDNILQDYLLKNVKIN